MSRRRGSEVVLPSVLENTGKAETTNEMTVPGQVGGQQAETAVAVADGLEVTDQAAPDAAGAAPFESEEAISVMLELPIGRPPTAAEYCTRELGVRSMTAFQSVALFQLRDGLSRAGAVLENGTPIKDGSGAIRYLLEAIARQCIRA